LIKVVAPAVRHPTNRALPEFHRYWSESHGPLFANTEDVRRYVQHLTLPEAYGGDPAPTFDGVSMFWYDDEVTIAHTPPTDEQMAEMMWAVLGTRPASIAEPAPEHARNVALVRAVMADDMQLFDRSLTWPMHGKRALLFAREHVIVDGTAAPEMVKAIFIVSKLPGLTLTEFFERWQHHHGPLVADTPGLRRYVQNHALPDAYAGGGQTHDGWSELWFEDLASLHRAASSAEWQAAREDGAMLFAEPIGVGVARERVQKDLDWTYNDWGVAGLDAAEIRDRLARWGYAALAADPGAPAALRTAAERQALAVWTDEHLVTIDDSRIDVRPGV
jgi:uncharacterized protein (TIGR02118 family)